MRQFFRPFRRKLGVLTLVVACALACLWVRSEKSTDIVITGIGGTRLLSGEGQLVVIPADSQIFLWLNSGRDDFMPFFGYQQYHEGLWTTTDKDVSWNIEPDLRHASIHYWSIVLPLTLLSAWLLVSGRRSPSPSKSQ